MLESPHRLTGSSMCNSRSQGTSPENSHEKNSSKTYARAARWNTKQPDRFPVLLPAPRNFATGMRVAFVHPDLGLGGAERFVVDAALSLKDLGHSPIIFTPYQDPCRTFTEVAPATREFPVRVVPSPFPRSFFGRCYAVLAALRCALLALFVCLFCKFDVAVVDIVSLPVLVFALFRKPVLFYCHYPDKLLAPSLRPGIPLSRLRKWYRRIVDRLEEFSLQFATSICCNSRFTSKVFARTFPRLRTPAVLYPCVNVRKQHAQKREVRKVLVSINRYERKKSISLAIEALAILVDSHPEARLFKLIIAGGYDSRLLENVQYYDELKRLAVARGLSSQVSFMQNISDIERRQLLNTATAVLYTPSNEHFGIVPLEAMAAGVPVIAVNSGGPVETIEGGVGGILCESSGAAFSDAIASLLKDPETVSRMGQAGRERAEKFFSREVLGREFQNVLVRLVDR